ncbi:7TMR-DISMED2 domain-containing protein [Litorilituus sediminis]|uniref:7TM-DISM receptor extracellular domain-containing protein n=1 Tax=Litorilituus sediminis TaxID=718192 RepID=A0A4V0ZFV1_9GAMM|nr:7TM-DISM domain-containing protein [Litorilituus sediminis]QBG35080.1 hypothetical protein EMK97_04740 [Litorilituus sediminis]
MVLICTLLVLFSFALKAKSVNVSELLSQAIGSYFTVIREQQAELSVEQTMQLMNEQGKLATTKHLNYGIWSRPVWFEAKLNNNEAEKLEAEDLEADHFAKRLTLAISWIDKLDIYLVQNSQVLTAYHLGDSLPFSQRAMVSDYR